MNKEETYINEISNYLLNSNVALFIGAGFSIDFGYPSWGKLLKDIILEYKLKEYLQDSSLFCKVSEDKFENYKEVNDEIFNNLLGVDYLKLAAYIDYLLNKKEEKSINEIIVESIQKCEEKRIRNVNIQIIIDFFDKYKEYINEIVTTNYDTNIEYCFHQDISVVHRGLSSLNSIEKKNKLYKIHGCINDQNKNIVITETDYQNFISKNRYLFYKIFSMFTEKKLVFLGYSINDPNIRSLLNEVIEESNNEVKLDIYWVNKFEVSELDREYYEKKFNLKIIENMEITSFMKRLDERTNKNLQLRKLDRENIVEIAEEYRKNYTDPIITGQLVTDNNNKNILIYFYNKVIEDRDIEYAIPFLELFISSDVQIQNELKLNLQTLFEDKSMTIYYILKYMSNETKNSMALYDYISNAKLSEILLLSSLDYCSGRHSFGKYNKYIKILIYLQKRFKSTIERMDIKIIQCLAENISKCSEQLWIGYDWKGLNSVRDYIKILDKEDVLKLIDIIGQKHMNAQTKEQFQCIFYSYPFDDIEKNTILYKYIRKNSVREVIVNTFDSVLKENYKKDCYIFSNEIDYLYTKKNEAINLKIKEINEAIIYEFSDIKLMNKVEIIQDFDSINNKCIIKFDSRQFDFDTNYEINEEILKEINEYLNSYIR
ncbi:hypothetical protein FC925_01215 [Clostridium botulinum]|nr:hypothetical protein [Clostridium botulinum]